MMGIIKKLYESTPCKILKVSLVCLVAVSGIIIPIAFSVARKNREETSSNENSTTINL